MRVNAPATSLATSLVRWPVITEADKAAVLAVLERGVLSGPFAPEVIAFQQEYAAYAGAKYALMTNSGTSALHIALASLGIGPGDEVICPAYTFIATALAVLHHNAIPVFMDIEPETCGMDPELLEKAITPRTRAIVPVHIHGIPCRIEAILKVAHKYGIPVIEDACQSHGATVAGKKVGTFGKIAAFSLQSSKNLTCGEGGLVVTNDPELLERAHRTWMFGENVRSADRASYQIERALDSDRAYDSVTMGWMYRSNEMSAALARSQLKRLDEWNEKACKNAEILSQGLSKLPGVEPLVVPQGSHAVFHKYRVRLDASQVNVDASPKRVRDAMLQALKVAGVEAVLWQTQPVPGQRLFQEKMGYGKGYPWSFSDPVDYRLEQFPKTMKLLESSLCLFSQTYPLAPQSAELCQAYVETFSQFWLKLDEVLATYSS